MQDARSQAHLPHLPQLCRLCKLFKLRFAGLTSAPGHASRLGGSTRDKSSSSLLSLRFLRFLDPWIPAFLGTSGARSWSDGKFRSGGAVGSHIHFSPKIPDLRTERRAFLFLADWKRPATGSSCRYITETRWLAGQQICSTRIVTEQSYS